MPIPTGFPQVTQVIGKPQTWEEGSCGSLPVFTDGHRWVSKWSFSEVELNKLLKTRCLWLTVAAAGHPPVSIDILPPLYPETPEKSAPKFDGVHCPRCKSTTGIRRLTFMWVEDRMDWSAKPLGRDVGPSTSVSECVNCGYQVLASTEDESREQRVCQAIHAVTGLRRNINESMIAYQARCIEKYGDAWPDILQSIVTRVMTEN